MGNRIHWTGSGGTAQQLIEYENGRRSRMVLPFGGLLGGFEGMLRLVSRWGQMRTAPEALPADRLASIQSCHRRAELGRMPR